MAVRVLIVNRHIDETAGGSETQCHEIANALAERGHDVTYAACSPSVAETLSLDDAERRPSEPATSGSAVPRSYAVYPLRGAFVGAFKRALEDVAPDVVYWRYNKRHLLPSVLAAKQRGARFVYAVSHINDVKVFAVKPFYGGRLGWPRRLMRAAGRVRDSIKGGLNYAALYLVDTVVFQHSGQIPPRFARPHVVIYNSQQHVAPLLGGLDQRRQARYVLWVANLKKSKNPEQFVRLAADLEDKDVEFWMVGRVQDPTYRHMLDSTALPRNFRYLGYQDRREVASLMRDCLFVVHTCDPEGFPNVFIQAWAEAKAVVSLHFDPGGLLTAHGIGLCSGSYETFRRDVALLIDDHTLRETMGCKAARFASEHCDRWRNVERLEKVLAGLLEPVPA